jgi:hypothetical protein
MFGVKVQFYVHGPKRREEDSAAWWQMRWKEPGVNLVAFICSKN